MSLDPSRDCYFKWSTPDCGCDGGNLVVDVAMLMVVAWLSVAYNYSGVVASNSSKRTSPTSNINPEAEAAR